jgi:hypothetical protein
MSTFELVEFIANLSFALSFIIALIFGIFQVRAAGRNRREQLTLEALRAVQTREFAELINYIVTTKFPTAQKEWDELPENDRIMFIQFGQQMESLGILVAEKIIDIDLVDKTLGSFVTQSWEKYKPMISVLREEEPYSNEYFQWLAEALDTRMREHPRKPVYQK